MARFPWERHEGDDVEAFASMCICRENPAARRFRPSQGDGGVDVYIPKGNNHVEIYQVKKFASNLTTNQVQQIKDSYERVKKYAESRGWIIDDWHLTLPLNGTKENDEMLEALNADDPFTAHWKGLSVFDNWAAEYPQALDYYLEGGKARLAEELKAFSAATTILLPGVEPETALTTYLELEPATVADRIMLLREALNTKDIHYAYDIAVGSAPPLRVRLS